MKKILIMILVAIMALSVFAHEAEELEEGKRLVESQTSCDELNDEQLETIGEYLMEQMHPGEAHEQMHEMMGLEEDSPAHEQVHVNMARMMYCGQMMGGMMNMMGPGMMQGGMMGPGMMGGMMGPQMMQGSGMPMMWSGMWGFTGILWFLIVLGLVILVWLWVVKLWKDVFRRKH